MNYLLINASPRGKDSNSNLLLSKLKEGLLRGGADESAVEIITLRPMLKEQGWRPHIEKAGCIVICFPLYADSVPGILKKFIEDLGQNAPEGEAPLKGKTLGWISQCGFPDSVHLDFVEKYLEKTTRRLGAESAGIIKKAGVEGVRIMPPSMTKGLFQNLQAFGEDLAVRGYFDRGRAEKLSEPRLFSPAKRMMIRFFSLIGITNFYWNKNLKENGAYEIRFAKPYEPGSV